MPGSARCSASWRYRCCSSGRWTPSQLYEADPAALATLLAAEKDAPSLAPDLIDARIDANADGLAKQWANIRVWVARTCGQVIATLPPEQWDTQIAYTAARIGHDADPWHTQLVYGETIAGGPERSPAL